MYILYAYMYYTFIYEYIFLRNRSSAYTKLFEICVSVCTRACVCAGERLILYPSVAPVIKECLSKCQDLRICVFCFPTMCRSSIVSMGCWGRSGEGALESNSILCVTLPQSLIYSHSVNTWIRE